MFRRFYFKNKNYWQVLKCCEIVSEDKPASLTRKQLVDACLEVLFEKYDAKQLSFSLFGINGTPKGKGVGLKRFNNILAKHGYEPYSVFVDSKGDIPNVKLEFHIDSVKRSVHPEKDFHLIEFTWCNRDADHRLNLDKVCESLLKTWNFDYAYARNLPYYFSPIQGSEYKVGFGMVEGKIDRTMFQWTDHAYETLYGKIKDFYPYNLLSHKQKERLAAATDLTPQPFGQNHYKATWTYEQIEALKQKHQSLTIVNQKTFKNLTN